MVLIEGLLPICLLPFISFFKNSDPDRIYHIHLLHTDLTKDILKRFFRKEHQDLC